MAGRRTTRLQPKRDEAEIGAEAETVAVPKAKPVSGLPKINDGRPAPPHRNAVPRPAFLYAWHPNRYGVQGDRVLPTLRKITMVDGLHGITHNRHTGQYDIEGLLGNAARQGWHIIRWDDPRLDSPYCVQAAPGVFADQHERVLASGAVREGGAPYRAWLAELVERGVVDPPSLDVLEDLKSRKQAEIQHLAGRPGSDHFRKAYEAEIAVIDAEIERQEAA